MDYEVKLTRIVTHTATVAVSADNQRDAAFLAGQVVTDDMWQPVEKIERVFGVERANGSAE